MLPSFGQAGPGRYLRQLFKGAPYFKSPWNMNGSPIFHCQSVKQAKVVTLSTTDHVGLEAQSHSFDHRAFTFEEIACYQGLFETTEEVVFVLLFQFLASNATICDRPRAMSNYMGSMHEHIS